MAQFSYFNPVQIHFGISCKEALGAIAKRCEKILLVSTKGTLFREPYIREILGKNVARVIDSIAPNPQVQDLARLARDLGEFEAIVAIGGGSVIDSAKYFKYALNSSLGNHCADLGDFDTQQTTSLVSRQNPPKTTQAKPQILEFEKYALDDSSESCDSRESQILGESKIPLDCHESANADSRNDNILADSRESQNFFAYFFSKKVSERQLKLKNISPLPFLRGGAGGGVESQNIESLQDSRKSSKSKRYFASLNMTDSHESPQDKPMCHSKIPIYAFPTTSGTSSELTKWATVWDFTRNIKHSINDISLYPHSAFYDPTITLKLPREITIHTALDALSHAFESVWNNNANPISMHYAQKAIEIILRDLPRLANALDSVILRESIMLASLFAGLAFSNTQTALAHAISYPLTMRFGTPHGLACSFSLPLLLENLPKDSVAYAILSPYKRDLVALFKTLDISTNPRDYGLDSVFVDEIFDNLNERAKNSIFDLGRIKSYFKHL